jgi:NADH dehydrogenase FAD-containing subunit
MRSFSFIALILGAVLPFVDANGLPEVIYRDVAVIGGGASGAYAAVRMRDDMNKSIALIEKQNILVRLINELRTIVSL